MPSGLRCVCTSNNSYKEVIGFWDVLFRSNAEGDFFIEEWRVKIEEWRVKIEEWRLKR